MLTEQAARSLWVVLTRLRMRPACHWLSRRRRRDPSHKPGKERLNRTLATECPYRQAFTSNADRTAALAPWLEHHNAVRRHSALGGEPPIPPVTNVVAG